MKAMFWKEPLIHFFVLGVVVFGLYGILAPEPKTAEDPLLVEVSSADIEWFRTMWVKRMGREPTVDELRGQVNRLIREQVLSREAKAMGLDQDDTVVRRRLTQKMDFLFNDLTEIDEPTDDELRQFMHQQSDRYQLPAAVSFTHIFFNPDERGNAETTHTVRQEIERLNSAKGLPEKLSQLGDPFLLPAVYSNIALPEIQQEFGPAFAEAVRRQPIGNWHGPIPSGYGQHAVLIQARSEPTLPDFEALKVKLRADWMVEKQRVLSRRAYEALRKRYRVLLEGMPYDLDLSS